MPIFSFPVHSKSYYTIPARQFGTESTTRPTHPKKRGTTARNTGGVDGKRPLIRVNPPRAHTYARISHFLFLAFTLHRSAQRVDFNGKWGEGSAPFQASPRVKAMVSAGEGVFTKAFTLIALWHSVLRGLCEEVKAKNENCLTRARARGNKGAKAIVGRCAAHLVCEDGEPDWPTDAALWARISDETCRLSCVMWCFGANVRSVYLVRGKLPTKANKCPARCFFSPIRLVAQCVCSTFALQTCRPERHSNHRL